MDGVKRTLHQVEAAGIRTELVNSKFSEKMLAIFTEAEPKKVRPLIAALEGTLNRSHDDTRLVLSLCLCLHELSGRPMPEFIKKLERAVKHLDKPAASTMIKTLRSSPVTAIHPKIVELRDLDAIAALSKAPADMIRSSSEAADALQVGTETISLTSSSRKDIEAAVRKVKAAAKEAAPRKERAPKVELPIEEKSSDDAELEAVSDDAGEAVYEAYPDELHNELDEASFILTKLLRSMPRQGRFTGLALAIEEAKKLLEYTRRDLLQGQGEGDAGLSMTN